MEKLTITIPEAFPIQDGNFVTVPSKSWNNLCETLNSIVAVVNAQSETILQNRNSIVTNADKIDTNTSNITKLAEIMEGIYETLE